MPALWGWDDGAAMTVFCFLGAFDLRVQLIVKRESYANEFADEAAPSIQWIGRFTMRDEAGEALGPVSTRVDARAWASGGARSELESELENDLA